MKILPTHKALSLLASPLGPRPVPNADDRRRAVAFVDAEMAHLSGFRRDKAIRQAADLAMIERTNVEHRARFDRKDAA